MSFKTIYQNLSNYPDLLDFIIVTFPESDFEGLPDVDAAYQYIAGNVPATQEIILKECNQLLNEIKPPWNEVADAANRWFEKDIEAKQWLEMITQVVKSIEPREGMAYAEVLFKKEDVKRRAASQVLLDFIFTNYLLLDYQKFSDNDTARNFALSAPYEQCEKVIQEGLELISDNNFPWGQVDTEVLNYKSPPSDFRKWLHDIVDIISNEISG